MSTSAKFCLDTNVLVYSFDRVAVAKRDQARTLIELALRTHTGVVTYQVIQEFLNVATRKFTPPMSRVEARQYIDAVLVPLCDTYASIGLYHEALGVQALGGFSFYDALIVAGALKSECAVLYSEALQDGRVVAGLKIVNPFAAAPQIRSQRSMT